MDIKLASFISKNPTKSTSAFFKMDSTKAKADWPLTTISTRDSSTREKKADTVRNTTPRQEWSWLALSRTGCWRRTEFQSRFHRSDRRIRRFLQNRNRNSVQSRSAKDLYKNTTYEWIRLETPLTNNANTRYNSITTRNIKNHTKWVLTRPN